MATSAMGTLSDITRIYLFSIGGNDKRERKISNILEKIPFTSYCFFSQDNPPKALREKDILHRILPQSELGYISARTQVTQKIFEKVEMVIKQKENVNKSKDIVVVVNSYVMRTYLCALFGRNKDAIRAAKGSIVSFEQRKTERFLMDCSGIEVKGIVPSENPIDPTLLSLDIEKGWGGLSPSEKIAFLESAIPYFSTPFQKDLCIKLREFHRQVIRPEEKAKATAAKDAYRQTLENMIAHIVSKGGKGYVKVVKGMLSPGACPINKLLLRCYEYGDSDTLSRYLDQLSPYFSSKEEEMAFTLVWAKKILDDFQKGLPISFPMMNKLLQEEKLGQLSLEYILPFTKKTIRPETSEKLAALMVEETQNAPETINIDEIIENRNLSAMQRLNQLQELAKNPKVAARLTGIYINNRLSFAKGDELQISFKERLKLLDELARIGSPDAAHIMGRFYKKGKTSKIHQEEGEEEPNMSLEERINSLYNMVLEGRHYEIGKEVLAPLFQEPFAGTLKLVFSTLAAIEEKQEK